MKRNNRPKINGAFVPILKDMIKSPAFLELTNASRVAYLLLKAQCCKFGQDEVKFPYSDAQEFMHQNTFHSSIKELERLGFIEITAIGGLFRRTNIYRFSEKWRDIKKQ